MTPIIGSSRSRLESLLLGALSIWGFAPVLWMLWHAATTSDVFTGADGPYAIDQMEYLDWVREGGTHVLIANEFTIGPVHAIFLHPMFVVSGALWRLGASLGLALQLWRPVAIVLLFAGTLAYVRRLLDGRRSQAAALAIALFFSAPVAALVNWAHIGSASTQLDFRIVAGELFTASRLWGYLPSIIAAGVMPLFLLGVEAILAGPDGTPWRTVAWTALAGVLCAWFHPWQGEALILMVALLCAWRRFDRRCARLALPALLTGLVIVYYLALRDYDAAWRIAGASQLQPPIPLGVLALSLAPIIVPALGGLRYPIDTQERLLLLWTPTVLAAYLIGGEASLLHLLEGLSLPLGILCVRAWSRVKVHPIATALSLAVLTIPGSAFIANQERRLVSRRIEATYLRAGEAAALRYLDNSRQPGAVLSTRYLAPAVPAFAGRQVWDGHPAWTPDWRRRTLLATRLFRGRLRGAMARGVIRESGAGFVLADCRSPIDLRESVGAGLLSAPKRFGCASLYLVR